MASIAGMTSNPSGRTYAYSGRIPGIRISVRTENRPGQTFYDIESEEHARAILGELCFLYGPPDGPKITGSGYPGDTDPIPPVVTVKWEGREPATYIREDRLDSYGRSPQPPSGDDQQSDQGEE